MALWAEKKRIPGSYVGLSILYKFCEVNGNRKKNNIGNKVLFSK